MSLNASGRPQERAMAICTCESTIAARSVRRPGAARRGEQEFLARYCALPGARLELRSGAAAEHVAKLAGAEQADMIALAWLQRLEPGRAAAVRRTVLDAEVPVMLVPIPPD